MDVTQDALTDKIKRQLGEMMYVICVQAIELDALRAELTARTPAPANGREAGRSGASRPPEGHHPAGASA